ncbi:hypothetical protein BC832DRAFT_569402 [Gaertneriomyces semiglobifer]|nr:hypothetical protein BC832DRAFT_569402 [Gaertneriomyces semiglobifer]
MCSLPFVQLDPRFWYEWLRISWFWNGFYSELQTQVNMVWLFQNLITIFWVLWKGKFAWPDARHNGQQPSESEMNKSRNDGFVKPTAPWISWQWQHLYLRSHQLFYLLELAVTRRLSEGSVYINIHHLLAIPLFEVFIRDSDCIALTTLLPFILHALYWVLLDQISESLGWAVLASYNLMFVFVNAYTALAGVGWGNKTRSQRTAILISAAILVSNLCWAWELKSTIWPSQTASKSASSPDRGTYFPSEISMHMDREVYHPEF